MCEMECTIYRNPFALWLSICEGSPCRPLSPEYQAQMVITEVLGVPSDT